jgi:hypothetical protein
MTEFCQDFFLLLVLCSRRDACAGPRPDGPRPRRPAQATCAPSTSSASSRGHGPAVSPHPPRAGRGTNSRLPPSTSWHRSVAEGLITNVDGTFRGVAASLVSSMPATASSSGIDVGSLEPFSPPPTSGARSRPAQIKPRARARRPSGRVTPPAPSCAINRRRQSLKAVAAAAPERWTAITGWSWPWPPTSRAGIASPWPRRRARSARGGGGGT